MDPAAEVAHVPMRECCGRKRRIACTATEKDTACGKTCLHYISLGRSHSVTQALHDSRTSSIHMQLHGLRRFNVIMT
eukprot:720164-Amphidinium_carterae.1